MGKTTKDEFNVRYTNKDIIERIEEVNTVAQAVLVQAKRTNGRVTTLETRSLGYWIGKNPIKFAVYFAAFLAIVVSDLRTPILNFLLGLF